MFQVLLGSAVLTLGPRFEITAANEICATRPRRLRKNSAGTLAVGPLVRYPPPPKTFRSNKKMAPTYLPFEIEGSTFLIETSCVREILGEQSLTRIPHGTERLPGVFAHKGIAIPVIDLTVVLNLFAQERSGDETTGQRRRTIVFHVGDDLAALAADEVWEVTQLKYEDLKEVRLNPRAFAQAEVQWFEQVATVLDVEAMLAATMSIGNDS
jgi:chemotaxis signal transduction protein